MAGEDTRQEEGIESGFDQKDRNYIFWQRDPLTILITNRIMAGEKLDYMHYNPLQPQRHRYPYA